MNHLLVESINVRNMHPKRIISGQYFALFFNSIKNHSHIESKGHLINNIHVMRSCFIILKPHFSAFFSTMIKPESILRQLVQFDLQFHKFPLSIFILQNITVSYQTWKCGSFIVSSWGVPSPEISRFGKRESIFCSRTFTISDSMLYLLVKSICSCSMTVS